MALQIAPRLGVKAVLTPDEALDIAAREPEYWPILKATHMLVSSHADSPIHLAS